VIRGTVSPALEAVVRLRVRGPGGLTADVDVVVDTGFDGALVFPAAVVASLGLTSGPRGTATLADGSTQQVDYFDGELEWGSGWVKVVAMALGSEALLAMLMLDGKKLTVEGTPGGLVEIVPWP
jgi:predicted aspartyl protease